MVAEVLGKSIDDGMNPYDWSKDKETNPERNRLIERGIKYRCCLLRDIKSAQQRTSCSKGARLYITVIACRPLGILPGKVERYRKDIPF